MRTEAASPPSEDDRLRYGLTAVLTRRELFELIRSGSEGALKSKQLTRVDGLEFASIGCGMLVLSEGATFHVVVCLRALDVCCEFEIRAKLSCCVSLAGRPVCSCAMPDESVWATGREVVTLPACLTRADLGSESDEENPNTPIEFCFLLRVTTTSPAFLKPPKVASFDGPPAKRAAEDAQSSPSEGGGDDAEDAESRDDEAWVTLRCRDGTVRAPRLLLLTHSDYCRVLLTSPLWAMVSDSEATIHCVTEYTSEMKRFLFYLQSYQCFNIARFETFRTLARISDQYGVPAVLLQCSRFLNHCLQIDAASSRTITSAASPTGAGVGLLTRITWTAGDLVSLWLTCNRHLHEPQLQLAVIRAIQRHFPYTSVLQSQDFLFLQESDKNCFYHEFCMVEGQPVHGN